MTLQTKSAVLGLGGDQTTARRARRRGLPSASAHIVPRPAKNCKPPGHLTPDEAKLWAAAEAIRDIDPIEYRERRRALLLAQAARWQPTT